MMNPQTLLTALGAPNPTAWPAQQTSKALGANAFQDLVAYFINIEQTSHALALQQENLADIDGSPTLLSAPLHLDIRIEGFRYLSAAEVSGHEPLRIQTLQTEQGLASRIEMITPEMSANGSVSYSVTILKLALRTMDLQALSLADQGGVLGSLPLALASGSVGDPLSAFLNQGLIESPIWSYQSNNTLDPMSNPQDSAKLLQELLDMAYSLMQYLNNLEMMQAFAMSKADKRRIEEAIKASEIDAAKRALRNEFIQKQINLEIGIKNLRKRKLNQEDAQNMARAQSLQHRLVSFFDQAQKLLSQDMLDPSVMEGLIGEYQHLDLELRKAVSAQAMARTAPTH